MTQGASHIQEDEVGSEGNDEETQASLAPSSPHESTAATQQHNTNPPHIINAPAVRRGGKRSTAKKAPLASQRSTNIPNNHIPTGLWSDTQNHLKGNGRAREPVPTPRTRVLTEAKKRNHNQISTQVFARTSSSAEQGASTPYCFRCKQRGPLSVLKRSCSQLVYCPSCGPHSSAQYKYPLCSHRRGEKDENARKAEAMRQSALGPCSGLWSDMKKQPNSDASDLNRDALPRCRDSKRRRHR